MLRLAEFLIAAVDLVGAQAREVGQTGRRAARSAALALAFGVVLLVGFLLLLASFVLALGPVLGYAGAACLAGVLAVGGGLLGLKASS